MALLSAQVRLPYKSGLPQDVATNTWWFESTTDGFVALAANAADFLNALYAGFDQHLAHFIDEAQARIYCYDWAQAEPRVPLTFALALTIADTQDALPGEVASVLSFRANPPSTPSRRGRCYLGPFRTNILTQGASTPPTVSSTFTTAVQSGITGAYLAIAGDDIAHVVYSRTNFATVPVAHYWMNNELDTQRRRGVEESARVNFTP